MFPKTITLTVASAAEEQCVEQALALQRELTRLAAMAPPGQVLDQCEQQAVDRGREFTRQTLEQAVQERLRTAEKKGRRSDAVRAARSGPTKGPAPAAS